MQPAPDKAYKTNSILKGRPRQIIKGYGQHSSRSSSLFAAGYVPTSSAAPPSQHRLGFSKNLLVEKTTNGVIPDSPDRFAVAAAKARAPVLDMKSLCMPKASVSSSTTTTTTSSLSVAASAPALQVAAPTPSSKENSSPSRDSEKEEAAQLKREKELQKLLKKKRSEAKAAAAAAAAGASKASVNASSSSSSSSARAAAQTAAAEAGPRVAAPAPAPSNSHLPPPPQPLPSVAASASATSTTAAATAVHASMPPPKPRQPASVATNATTTTATATATATAAATTSSSLVSKERAVRGPGSTNPPPPALPTSHSHSHSNSNSYSSSSSSSSSSSARAATAAASFAPFQSAPYTSASAAASSAQQARPPLAAGQITDNFVRRNLKKKGAYRQKQKDPRFQRKTRGGGKDGSDDDGAGSDSGDGSDSDGGMGKGKGSRRGGAGGSGSSGQSRTVISGLAAMGLDPLQLSLDAIAPPPAPAPGPSSSSSSAVAKAASKLVPRSRASTIDPINGRPHSAAAVAASGSAPTAVRAKSAGRRGSSLSDAVLEENAPCCPGHQFPAKLLIVKKPGANKNRRFYGCSFSAEQRCKFFMWAEDNPTLIALALTATREIFGSAQDGGGALEAFCKRLEQLTTDELKDEIRRFQRRKMLTSGGAGKGGKLTLSGKRDVLLKRLVAEAASALGKPLPATASADADAGKGDDDDSGDDDAEAPLAGGGRAKAPSASTAAAAAAKAASAAAGTAKPKPKHKPQPQPKPQSKATTATRAAKLRSQSRGVSSGKGRGGFAQSDDDDDDDDEEGMDEELVDRVDVVNAAADDSDEDSDEESEEEDESVEEEEEEEEEEEDEVDVFDSKKRRRTGASASSVAVSGQYVFGKDAVLDRLRGTFGHSALRPGQRWAMERCINGQSSMLVMPTGAGKSLCYMLPAAELPGLTLVVCPLISLMQDQLKKLPVELPGASLSGSPTAFESAQISQALLQGHIRVLFVSPERLCTSAFRSLMQRLNEAARQRTGDAGASAISLLCVDEAHCLSQWSYNFRPSFLRIRREIRHLQPRAVLALTATAPPHIQREVMSHLGIDPESGLLALPPRRSNLELSACIVDGQDKKNEAIVAFIRAQAEGVSGKALNSNGGGGGGGGGGDDANMAVSGRGGRWQRSLALKRSRNRSHPKASGDAIPPTIVYVWRRYEAEALSEYLTAEGLPAVGYHAGMDADKRQRAQLAFTRGTARIVVATISFGMGVDKADVRCVVHSSVPTSVENYLQETGRAGRDGRTARCHLLLDPDDLEQHHSLSFSSRLCVLQVVALLARVFVPCSSGAGTTMPPVAVRLGPAERDLDLSDSAVETIFSVLELPPFGLLQVDGVHLDAIAGQFRCVDSKLTDLLRYDPIVKALFEVDPQLKEKARKRAQRAAALEAGAGAGAGGMGMGMGSMATYGFGSDGADADRESLAESAAAYGRQPFGPLSLLRLATLAGLTYDECTRGLYMLQTQGVLEYRLSEHAVYLTPTLTQSLSGTGESPWTGDRFVPSLWSLAERVTQRINSINDLAGQRTLDMWRLGATIAACKVGGGLGEEQEQEQQERQEQISSLMCHYMQTLSSASEEESGGGEAVAMADGDADDVGGGMGELLDSFQQTQVPLLFLPEVGDSQLQGQTQDQAQAQAQAQAQKELGRLSADVDVLRHDPRLSDLLRHLCAFADSPLLRGAPSLGSAVADASRRLWASYMAKVLHGIGSPLLPAANWRGHQLWGKYRRVHFDDVLRVVLARL